MRHDRSIELAPSLGPQFDYATLSALPEWFVIVAECGVCGHEEELDRRAIGRLRGATRAMVDSVGNIEPEIEVWPDGMAPVVRNTPTGREPAMVRWGAAELWPGAVRGGDQPGQQAARQGQ
ncbi:hypothetical protein GGD55_002786 [Rhizobium giardinii]|uniref:Uncharacterized protein n=1 Tax=Rhizobium giardinii TaxID=56731 RepID=A0A7W8UC73_9HYPH|nr:hypothetical protein [Rhizobium giardinii]